MEWGGEGPICLTREPERSARRHWRSVRRLAAAALLAAGVWVPSVSSPPAARAVVCTGWSSTTAPPPTVNVLRTSGPASGSVQTVDFNTYVKVVMAPEWSGNWPQEVLRAGAVAIKQYAWYKAIYPRSSTAGCYDVVDNTNDQIYQPETRTPTAPQIQAVDSTWPESILKNGVFIQTGYRPGDPHNGCGTDADGSHLFQWSASYCASGAGMTGEQILDVYYGPGLLIQGIAVPDAPTSASAIPYDTSAWVTWAAPAFDGNLPVTAYEVTSTPDGKTCTTTGELSCALPGLANGSAYTFTVTATNSAGTSPASGASAAVTPGPVAGATYVPLAPTRILDTRFGNGLSNVFSSHVARTFAVAGVGGVPSNATAVTGNLTVTAQTSGGYLFIGPVATNNPTSSTLNFPVGDDRANGVTVALGGGTLSVTYVASAGVATAHVIFDVTGYFVPDTSGSTYVPLNPARILDTRNGTGLAGPSSSHVARSFAVAGRGGVPANATAVTGNLTVTAQTSGGYLFIGPVATNNPTSSTLNFPAGDDRANGVTVALGGGTLGVTYVASAGVATAHVIFDVTGYFAPGVGGSAYVPLNPARVVDSRNGTGLAGPSGSHVARSFTVAGTGNVPPTATAVTGNVTVTGQTSNGYLFIGPVETNDPTSSTLNFPVGDDRANGVTVALGGGTLSVTFVAPAPGPTTHLIFDVTGYFQP